MLSLRQVLCEGENGVLLGFSSDGNFLGTCAAAVVSCRVERELRCLSVYCIALDSCYEVQWRRFKFQAFYHWREDGEAPETVLKLRVDGRASVYGLSTPLEVWQSVDWNLVLAVTTDHLSEENSRLCRVVVAPSPMFGDAAVTRMSFEFRQHALSQKMEKWQLMQLVRGQKCVYHLLVNAGTVVHVLVFHTQRVESNAAEVAPRGLGISHLPQKAWYYTPVFPIKLLKSKEHRQNKRHFTVECLCQHLFDVERFLEEFLETFKALQHCNLVDYDLRLVRVISELVSYTSYNVNVMRDDLLILTGQHFGEDNIYDLCYGACSITVTM
ncbi:Hypothetical protein PHPALM_18529 [Phytophthora palmivora]|uniref:Uncharacterized protein n=1 Tax=Phytophthora palmivora TaxID=4796 RepID=A0A2P4XJJ9_9STRA|nr:Hypothetical protein PHPALM_18529 [Phytophthora palmivora]